MSQPLGLIGSRACVYATIRKPPTTGLLPASRAFAGSFVPFVGLLFRGHFERAMITEFLSLNTCTWIYSFGFMLVAINENSKQQCQQSKGQDLFNAKRSISPQVCSDDLI